MPTLDWIGKEKVVNHHLEVPYRVLEKQYTYNAGDSENMIIHGDNLEALKSLLPQYEGQIKCIYIDPPYNTGNENWVYNDNVNDPKIKKWLGGVARQRGGGFKPPRQMAVYDVPPVKAAAKVVGRGWGYFYQY